jgi:hypothetical protein
LLDPFGDKAEIEQIKSYTATMLMKGRGMTPILVPLADHLPLKDLVNPTAGVAFDLDGSGIARRWGWITPKAAWLVYDPTEQGKITSGLQLFGNVTFWVFWRNGYEALRALDDDGDGVLTGDELRGLALWQDRDSNGISAPDEVIPLAVAGVTALSTESVRHETGIPYSPSGVRFLDGSFRPTYDWMATPVADSKSAGAQ